MIPDEGFFIMIALCPDLKYKNKIISDTRRYIYFPEGHSHPISLHDGDEDLLTRDGKEYFFARKINALQEKKLVEWMLGYRENIDKKLGISMNDLHK